MLEKLELIKDRCIVKIIEEQKGAVLASGIFLPSTTKIQTKYKKAIVMLVNPEDDYLNVGDVIYIEPGGIKVEYNGESCLNINSEPVEGQVLGIISTP